MKRFGHLWDKLKHTYIPHSQGPHTPFQELLLQGGGFGLNHPCLLATRALVEEGFGPFEGIGMTNKTASPLRGHYTELKDLQALFRSWAIVVPGRMPQWILCIIKWSPKGGFALWTFLTKQESIPKQTHHGCCLTPISISKRLKSSLSPP